jgi:hypothetical protein
MNVLGKARSIVIRASALVAVLVTYAAGNIGPQIAAAVGVSTLAVTTSATPAGAGWRRRGTWRTPGWQGWGWRRGWHRCWWGEWC